MSENNLMWTETGDYIDQDDDNYVDENGDTYVFSDIPCVLITTNNEVLTDGE